MNADGQYHHRRAQAITATVACAFMLGCGRWGAHLGVPPFYIGDVLLAIAVSHAVVSRVIAGPRPGDGAALRGHPGAAVFLFLGWATLRFVTGQQHGLDALRDFVPYAYALVACLSALGYARSSAADRRRTLRFIDLALIWHLLWVVVSLLAYGVDATAASSETFGLLLVRGDTDGAVLGMTACLFLMRYLRRGGLWRLLVAVVSLGFMFAMTSRAAVLATLTGLVLSLWLYGVSNREAPGDNPRRRLVALGFLPIALVAFVLVLPYTTAGSKLLTSAGLKEAESRIDEGGLGSKRARSAAWERVRDYTEETLSRQAAGVGFGENFMIDSGASIALLSGNAPDVRSPHNYFVTTYARLGLIGLALLALLFLHLAVGIWRVQRHAGSDDLLLLAVIVPPMILAEAGVGVVLEAPFGAIPFFWFLGILLSRPVPPPGPDQGRAAQPSAELEDLTTSRSRG